MGSGPGGSHGQPVFARGTGMWERRTGAALPGAPPPSFPRCARSRADVYDDGAADVTSNETVTWSALPSETLWGEVGSSVKSYEMPSCRPTETS